MRLGAGIGLLALLLGVALMFFLFAGPLGPGGSSYGGNLAKKNNEAKATANRFAGRDADGQRVADSLVLTPFPETGDLRGFTIESVTPGGVAETHFGLEPGDVIEQVGVMPVGGPGGLTGVDGARDFLDDAFARRLALKVRREGETLELPANGASPGAAGLGGLPGLP